MNWEAFAAFWNDLWNQIVSFFTAAEEGQVSFINRLLISLSILIVGIVLIKLIYWILKTCFKVNNRKTMSPAKTVTRFVLNASKTFFLFLVILFALSTLGFKLTGLATILSSGILAIGVSLQDVISNFASGIIILSSKLYSEGDYIEINDSISGSVKEIKMMTTILTTPDNILVTVPNSTVTKGKVTNYNQITKRRVNLTVSVAYGTDLTKAKKILMNTIINNPMILKDEPIQVAVMNLGASSIDFTVRGWVKPDDYWTTKFALTEAIANELSKRNVNIPFNQLDVNLYNSKASDKKIDMKGIPSDVLDYKPEEKLIDETNDIEKAFNKAKNLIVFNKGKTKKTTKKKPVEKPDGVVEEKEDKKEDK